MRALELHSRLGLVSRSRVICLGVLANVAQADSLPRGRARSGRTLAVAIRFAV